MKQLTILFIISLLFTACKKEESEGRFYASYTATVTFYWNSTDFPTSYPANAHFSKLIGWSHGPNDTLMKRGTYATTGIKDMAERGQTSPLDNEIEEMGYTPVIGESLSTGTGELSIDIDVSIDHPRISLCTMVAPSPDWYVAAVSVNLFENELFVDKKTVNAYVYDAGTDDGTTFTSANSVSTPPQPITLFVDTPLGNGVTVKPVFAKVTFTKL
ncbi:MAG: spondin domain-containing protein [Flavobacteriales bacterium]|nr:spondin domain-containing protein [Flavobacteriales bacterium]